MGELCHVNQYPGSEKLRSIKNELCSMKSKSHEILDIPWDDLCSPKITRSVFCLTMDIPVMNPKFAYSCQQILDSVSYTDTNIFGNGPTLAPMIQKRTLVKVMSFDHLLPSLDTALHINHEPLPEKSDNWLYKKHSNRGRPLTYRNGRDTFFKKNPRSIRSIQQAYSTDDINSKFSCSSGPVRSKSLSSIPSQSKKEDKQKKKPRDLKTRVKLYRWLRAIFKFTLRHRVHPS